MEFGTAIVHVPYQYQPRLRLDSGTHQQTSNIHDTNPAESDTDEAAPPDIKRFRRDSATTLEQHRNNGRLISALRTRAAAALNDSNRYSNQDESDVYEPSQLPGCPPSTSSICHEQHDWSPDDNNLERTLPSYKAGGRPSSLPEADRVTDKSYLGLRPSVSTVNDTQLDRLARPKRLSLPVRPHIMDLSIDTQLRRPASTTTSLSGSVPSPFAFPDASPEQDPNNEHPSSSSESSIDEEPMTPIEDYSWPPRRFQHPRTKNLELQREICPRPTPVSRYSKFLGLHKTPKSRSGPNDSSRPMSSSSTCSTSSACVPCATVKSLKEKAANSNTGRSSPVQRLRTSLDRRSSRRTSALTSVAEDTEFSHEEAQSRSTGDTSGHRRWSSLPVPPKPSDPPKQRSLSTSNASLTPSRRLSLFPAPFDPTAHTFRATVLSSTPAHLSPISPSSPVSSLSRASSIRDFPLPPGPAWPLRQPRGDHSPNCPDDGACHPDCGHPAYRPVGEPISPRRRVSSASGATMFHYPCRREEEWSSIASSRGRWIRERRRGSVVWRLPDGEGSDDGSEGMSFLEDSSDRETA